MIRIFLLIILLVLSAGFLIDGLRVILQAGDGLVPSAAHPAIAGACLVVFGIVFGVCAAWLLWPASQDSTDAHGVQRGA